MPIKNKDKEGTQLAQAEGKKMGNNSLMHCECTHCEKHSKKEERGYICRLDIGGGREHRERNFVEVLSLEKNSVQALRENLWNGDF